MPTTKVRASAPRVDATGAVLVDLGALRVSPSLSRETVAYTAKILLNGVVAGDVCNHGDGGPDLIHMERDTMDALTPRAEAWVRAQHARDPVLSKCRGDEAWDLLLTAIRERQETAKVIKRALRTWDACFRLPTDQPGLIRKVRGAPGANAEASTKADVSKRFPGAVFLTGDEPTAVALPLESPETESDHAPREGFVPKPFEAPCGLGMAYHRALDTGEECPVCGHVTPLSAGRTAVYTHYMTHAPKVV